MQVRNKLHMITGQFSSTHSAEQYAAAVLYSTHLHW